MKKKLFLMVVMTFVLVLALAFAVSADSVHNESTVDYKATVTLNDGTVLPLYDENKEALIWYIDGKDDEGKTKYSSVRSDDRNRIIWEAVGWDEVQTWSAYLEDGKTSIKSNIVVINLMDDDVVRNTGNQNFLNKPMDNFKFLFSNMANLEYCFLRLDTRSINRNSFNNCKKLKYINLENLTKLTRMAQDYHFAGCTSLFDGQVLDLTKTQLWEFEYNSTFEGVPFKGVKFPETMKKMGGSTFKNCTKLEFVSVGNKAVFNSDSFEGCTSLKAIYYVGTEDELKASSIISSAVTNATIKSYAEYKALSDKSGVYAVYNYSRCEAFNGGVHGEATTVNACVGICNVCNDTLVNHTEKENLSTSISYTDYSKAGTKTVACLNDGCGYKATEEVPAIFTALGYSTPIEEDGRIVFGYSVNKTALEEYGKEISYGIYAIAYEKIGDSDIVNADATANNGAIAVDVSKEYLSFEFIISGFETDELKTAKLSLGTYVIEDGKVSYIQLGTLTDTEDAKYTYTTYNDFIASLK